MRLTTRTNLAMRTLMFCAINSNRTVLRQDIAAACNASENHLAQVVNTLGQLGYVRTSRGRNGGLLLGLPMEQIRVGDVLRVFEAAVPFAECFPDGGNTCQLTHACRLKPALAAAVEAFYAALDHLTLADLAADNPALHQILHMDLVGCAAPSCELRPS